MDKQKVSQCLKKDKQKKKQNLKHFLGPMRLFFMPFHGSFTQRSYNESPHFFKVSTVSKCLCYYSNIFRLHMQCLALHHLDCKTVLMSQQKAFLALHFWQFFNVYSH